MKFEDKLREYINKQDLILKDKIDFNKVSISIDDVDEIEDLISLYIMKKNNTLGKLKVHFEEKMSNLNTSLSNCEIFSLFDIAIDKKEI